MKLAQLFKQSSIYMVGEFVRRAIGFVMIPVYTRYLSTSDYGILELIDLFVMIAGVYFGMEAIVDGMLRIYHDYADERSQAAVVSTAVIGTAGCGLLVAAVAAVTAMPLSRLAYGSASYAWLIRMSFVALFFGSLMEIGLAYQRIRERAALFVSFSVVQILVNVGLNIYFIAFRGMGLWGFLLSKLVVTSLGSAYLLAILFRETGFALRTDVARRIARFAGPLIISGGGIFTIHFADRFFVNHYGSLSDVGIYGLAYKFGFLVSYGVGQPFASVWGARLYAHASGEMWKQQFARVVTYLAFFLVLAAAGLALFIDKILGFVAPPAYLPAAMLIPIVAFGYVFREIGDYFRGILFINKRVYLFGRITVACAALNLALNWILISQYKAAGAAWATMLTWLAYMAACWIMAYSEHHIPYPVKSFLLLCSLAAAVWLASTRMKMLPLGWQWAADGGLALLFVGAVWSTGYFSAEERDTIRQQLASTLSWRSAD
ncbi:MAG: polysaccharide biosynthesis C-terminal domain-containing protein [Bryobacterales bacterium]|nr:polysaccharide biosynthesis C-terminal domain-containing protein [Bryobacterales bacterium]